MEGAPSCSVLANVAGAGTISIYPRPDAGTPAATPTDITTSGASTFTSDAGQFSVKFAAADKSANVTLTCSPGGGASGIDGSYDNTTSGLAATTLQGAVDELEASKAEVTSQTSVLLQGQNGIAAVSDPNDVTASPDVVCGTATPGSCLFISDKGIEFVNTSLTKWRAVAAKHYDYIYEPMTSQSIGAALDGTKCLGNPWSNSGDRVSACTSHKSEIRAVTDITLDTFTVFVTDVSGSAVTLRGCAICVSLDGGATCATGSDVSLPSADGIALTEGSTNSTTLNIQIAKGDFFHLYALNGEFSEAGGEGVCSSLGSQHLGVNLEFYER